MLALAIISIWSYPVAAQTRRPPLQDECPQGREIRVKKHYPATMSDCDVLDEDTRRENQRSRGSDVGPRQPAPPVATQPPVETPAQKAAKQVQADLSFGYTTITADDFVLDSKVIIASGKKVVVEGYYRKIGNLEGLYPTQDAANAAERVADIPHINLLTDDAARDLRAYFLKCGPGRDMLGCWTRVRGHAEMCSLTILGNTIPKPCLVAESGWFLNN